MQHTGTERSDLTQGGVARRSVLGAMAGAAWLAASPASAGGLLPGGAPRVSFPFRLLADAVFIPVSANGAPARPFWIDTGSSNTVIARELAPELGVTGGAAFLSSGAGSDSNVSNHIERLDIALPGGVTRSTNRGALISMAGLWPLIGERVYGGLGHDVIQAFVVEFDYAARRITLHDPASWRPPRSGTTFAAQMCDGFDPQIEGALFVPGRPPIPVWFTLDTGAGGVVVTSPVVDNNRLLEAVGPSLATTDNGVGGAKPTEVMARLAGFRIGPYWVDKPIVALSRDKVGGLANPKRSVNVGGSLLSRFTVAIDYPNGRVTLTPNAQLADRFEADASGMIVAAEGDDFRTFVVRAIQADTPASEAGMREGDVIAAVDGRPARAYALWQLQDALKPAGAVVRLQVRRDGRTSVRPLRLRTLI